MQQQTTASQKLRRRLRFVSQWSPPSTEVLVRQDVSTSGAGVKRVDAPCNVTVEMGRCSPQSAIASLQHTKVCNAASDGGCAHGANWIDHRRTNCRACVPLSDHLRFASRVFGLELQRQVADIFSLPRQHLPKRPLDSFYSLSNFVSEFLRLGHGSGK